MKTRETQAGRDRTRRVENGTTGAKLRRRGLHATRLVVLLPALALLLVLAACQVRDDGSLERVKRSGVLRVGMDASFPPFESLDADGYPIGFDVDLAGVIADSLGVRPEFVNVGFDGLYDALLAGRVDVIISGLPYDPRRTQDVIYSSPYFYAGQVLVMPAADAPETSNTPDVAGLLVGKIVAVEWGSMADVEARRLQSEAQDMELLLQPTALEALSALLDGRANAAIVEAVSAHQFVAAHDQRVGIARQLTEEPYVIACHKHSVQLAKQIDDILADLDRSGRLERLLSAWLGVQ